MLLLVLDEGAQGRMHDCLGQACCAAGVENVEWMRGGELLELERLIRRATSRSAGRKQGGMPKDALYLCRKDSYSSATTFVAVKPSMPRSQPTLLMTTTSSRPFCIRALTISSVLSVLLHSLPLYTVPLSAKRTLGPIWARRSSTALTPLSGLMPVQMAPTEAAARAATTACT